ncbi:threonine-phosphate decarboxylase [Methylophaga sp. 42_25_T18]|nr:threonine-phosphate decarboxylase [Methylophaga sp. 42_25_T18]OUR88522.1 threonine-phosphate decarboxylase [Methylophaga sp. 42_8_T64]
MLEHGGNLYSAALQYDIPISDWLDLSTGINPNGWPVPTTFPAEVWSQLPQQDDGLVTTAQDYYQCKSLLAVAGSQAAIQALPYLRGNGRVGIIAPAYAEHAYAWQQAGHEVIPLDIDSISNAIIQLDVLVIINPNNPSAQQFSSEQLLSWHQQLLAKNGWLIIDEAFIDSSPEHSLATHCPTNGLVVLRSLGKFFGLAGLRIGFVLAEATLLKQLADRLGPWPIAHASRYVAQLALQDKMWQQQCRHQLRQQGSRLQQLLTRAGLKPHGSSDLFHWVKIDNAELVHQNLAQQGILTRVFETPSSLRFGLPKSESDWQRLQAALQQLDLP